MEGAGIRLSIREVEPACVDQDNAVLLWKGVEAMLLRNPDEWNMLRETVESVFYDEPVSEATRDKINDIATRNQSPLLACLFFEGLDSLF